MERQSGSCQGGRLSCKRPRTWSHVGLWNDLKALNAEGFAPLEMKESRKRPNSEMVGEGSTEVKKLKIGNEPQMGNSWSGLKAEVVELLATLEATTKTTKQFRSVSTRLWNILIPLRLKYQLATTFRPEARQFELQKKASNTSIDELVWITQSYREFLHVLQSTLEIGSSKVATASLQFFFEGIKTESTIRLKQQTPKTAFPIKLFDSIIEAILFAKQENFPDLLVCLRNSFLEPFRDLRFHAVRAVESAISLIRRDAPKDAPKKSAVATGDLSHRLFLLLTTLPTPAEINKETMGTANWTPEGVSRQKSDSPEIYKAAFVSAWTTYLQLDADELVLSPVVYKEILTVLPTTLLPFMSAPLKLAKFFLLGFHGGDVAIAVQSLSGLFYLLVKGRLGEPQLIDQEGQNFYHRLFSLLQPKVFSLPVRVRFLRLLRLSLQSKLLSTEMRAVFVKKLVAASILTPPSASLWLLAVALRMLQSGGVAMAPVIHSSTSTIRDQKEEDSDPLAPYEIPENVKIQFKDRICLWDGDELCRTLKTDKTRNDSDHINGIENGENEENNRQKLFRRMSIWEVEIAKMHWHPSIRQIAALFNAEMFKPTASKIDPDDFLATDLGDLIVHALKELLKRVAAVQLYDGVSRNTANGLCRCCCCQ